MPIPKTREELTEQVLTSFAGLRQELEQAGPRLAEIHCVDSWDVKDLLAVRAWWAESVVDWKLAGEASWPRRRLPGTNGMRPPDSIPTS